MAAGHDQDDGEEPRDRQRVPAEPGEARRPVIRPGRRRAVQVLGDAVGVDDGDQPVQQDAEVEDEDRIEDRRVDQEAEQRDPVDPQDHPRAEREDEDRPGREGQGAQRGTGVELTESGEDQGEEGGRERRPVTRSRALRFVHRG